MDHEKCYYELNLNCQNILNKNWKFPSLEKFDKIGMFYPWTHEAFDPLWLKYAQSLGLHFRMKTILFYRKPYQEQTIAHIDVNANKTYTVCGINYVVGGEDSEMIWYKEPEIQSDFRITSDQSAYKVFPMDKLEEIERFNINGKITLVKTSVPHTILSGSKERWCFSLRFVLTDQFKNWDQVVNFMRSKKLLIER